MEINGVECVDVEAAANRIGVSAGRVRQLIADGTLPVMPLGMRKKWIAIEAIDAYKKTSRPVGNPTFVKRSPSA